MATTDDRRSGRDRSWTDAESEGVPALATQPPGSTAETSVEGLPLPEDHPVGVDERGTTELGEMQPDTVAERAARERPNLPQRLPDGPEGRLTQGATDQDDPATGEWADDSAGLAAEEAAIHVQPD